MAVGCNTISLLLQVVGVLAEFPVSDPMVEALELISLIGEEGLDERFPENVRHLGVLLEGLQRGLKITWQLLSLARVVPIAFECFGRLQLVADSQISSRQQSCNRQIGIGAGVAESQLHPGRSAALRRHPHHRTSVVQAPVDQPGSERVRAETLEGIDRWVAYCR